MNVEQELQDLKNRVGNLESKAVAAFIGGENWVRRNVLWVVPVAMLVSFLVGHFGR